MLIERGKANGWLRLDVNETQEWARLSGVTFSAASATLIPGRGLGLTADRDLTAPLEVLSVAEHLVLSIETVKQHAQFDSDFRGLFESLGASITSSRMAILSFLLFQASISCPDLAEKVGVHSPFTDYVKTLPCELLPTFWSVEELHLLVGTTLAPAVSAKLRSLRREYDLLCSSAANTRWFRIVQPFLDFDDWKQVDAMFRSRALDFHGQCMIPGIDLSSHAAGPATNTFYDRRDGAYVLFLMDDKKLTKGEEVTITYGDEKGACEMLFSYGFIDEHMQSAETMFLSLTIPDDDVFKTAKISIAQCAPGFKIIDTSGDRSKDSFNDPSSFCALQPVYARTEFDWTGDFIWLLCVGQEDGLEFRLARANDSLEDEMEAILNGQIVKSGSDVRSVLTQSPLWDVYRLRAVVILQQRVFDQMQLLHSTQDDIESLSHGDGSTVREQQYQLAMQLRKLEFDLLGEAYEGFEMQKLALAESDVVKRYLASG